MVSGFYFRFVLNRIRKAWKTACRKQASHQLSKSLLVAYLLNTLNNMPSFNQGKQTPVVRCRLPRPTKK